MILKLTDVRKKLPFKVSKGLSMFYIKDWAINKYGDEIDWNVYLPTKGKNLQRPFVWTLQQKQELILSMLKEIDIPAISAIQYKEYPNKGGLDRKCIFKIIDGKQRFSTMIDFYLNKFPIVWDTWEYYFLNLDDKAQWAIANYMPKFDIVYEYPDTLLSDNDKILWFEMINFLGTPQDKEHLLNLKF